MVAERAQAVGPLRFAIDAAFADESVYVHESPDGLSSICVELEPIRDRVTDTPARRLAQLAEELGRVYDDARVDAPREMLTGAGTALVLRAVVLGGTEIAAACLDLEALRVYVTATSEKRGSTAFALAVESLRSLAAAPPPAPLGHRRTGAGIVSLLIPATWTTPSLARFRCRSAIVEVGEGSAPAEVSAADLVPLARGETLALDGHQPAERTVRAGLVFETAVSTYTVRDEAGAPADAIMVRATAIASEGDDLPVAFARAAARSADWPQLIAAWAPLVASFDGKA